MIGKGEVNIGASKGLRIKSSKIPGLIVESPSCRAFTFMISFFGSTSSVSKGSFGVDYVCLPLEAITEIVDLPQWSHHNGVSRCIVEIL